MQGRQIVVYRAVARMQNAECKNAKLWYLLRKIIENMGVSPYHHFLFCILHFAFCSLKRSFKLQFIAHMSMKKGCVFTHPSFYAFSPEASWWGPHEDTEHNPTLTFITLYTYIFSKVQNTYLYTALHTSCSEWCKIGVRGVWSFFGCRE